jgi:hypothetical protein
MKMPLRKLLPLLLLALVVALNPGVGADPYKPEIDPTNFLQGNVDNPYFPLVPGTVLKYSEKTGSETSENEITVTRDTKMIMGVKCLVVHDTVTAKGQLKEDTYDWYAQDTHGAVWYFGEATKEFKGKSAFSTKGSWEAGINGLPGIIMPANPVPGKPYRQEYSPKNAEDMGQVVSVGESVTVPAGSFTECVKTKDWSLLEAGSENKWYAKGVGVVKTKSSKGETAILVSIKRP